MARQSGMGGEAVGLVLSFSADLVRLSGRGADGAWVELGVAQTADPSFGEAARAFGAAAGRFASGAAVDVALPPEHGLTLSLDADAGEDEAVAALSKALGPRARQAVWALGAARSGRPRLLCAADADTVREARLYAESWGLKPRSVSVGGADGLPNGPALWRLAAPAQPAQRPAPAKEAAGRRSRGGARWLAGLLGAGALACGVAAFAAFAPPQGDDRAPERSGPALATAPLAPAAVAPAAAPPRIAAVEAASSAGRDAPEPPAVRNGLQGPPRFETETAASRVLLAGVLPPAAATFAWRAPFSTGLERPPFALIDAPLKAPPPSFRPTPAETAPPAPLARPGEDATEAAPQGETAEPLRDVAPPTAAADVVPSGEAAGAPQEVATPSLEGAAAAPVAEASAAEAPSPEQAPVAEADAPAAAASADTRSDLLEAAAGEAEEAAPAEAAAAEPVGPRPSPRPAALAAKAEAAIARAEASARAPKPTRRPALAARPPSSATAQGARPPSSVGRSVSSAATIRNGLPASGPNLIGVFGAPNGRRAIIRDGSGALRRVAAGDRVDGWVVGAISEESVRLRSGSTTSTLRLPGR